MNVARASERKRPRRVAKKIWQRWNYMHYFKTGKCEDCGEREGDPVDDCRVMWFVCQPCQREQGGW